MTTNTPVTYNRNIAYKENPFLDAINPRTRVRREGAKGTAYAISDPETGEGHGTAQFYSIKTVEDTQFIKWFIEGMRTHAQLNASGVKVFELLYLAVQRNVGKDNVDLSFQLMTDAQKQNMSYKTYLRGIAELEDKQFIARMPASGRFWINPAYMWNGDRYQFITEYRRKSARQIEDAGRGKTDPPLTITQRPVDPNQTDIEHAIAEAKDTEK